MKDTYIYIASLFAVTLSITAIVFALMGAGPRGATGATGPRGTQGVAGIAGPAGKAASTVALVQIRRCLPELTKWVGAFSVSTSYQYSGDTSWLTNAYLDTSAQQVSKPCQKILGFTPSTGGL